jgi:hypothetical protein
MNQNFAAIILGGTGKSVVFTRFLAGKLKD